MENNKTYLHKIHWIFLIGILYSAYSLFAVPWFYKLIGDESNVTFILFTVLNAIILYSAIGLATGKWKEACIAAGFMILIGILYYLLPGSHFSGKRILFYFLFPLHIIVFTGLQSGWKSKLFGVYGFALLLSVSYMLATYAAQKMGMLLKTVIENYDVSGETYVQGFNFIFGIAQFLFTIIYTCESLHYATREYPGKTVTLNLGNEVPKLNGIIAFWVMRIMLIILVVGSILLIQTLPYTLKIDFRTDVYGYLRLILVMAIPGVILMALFISWYTRKLLLENFIIYNINSKFLYWFSLLPLVGFFAFLVIQTNAKLQVKYKERKAALTAFADNNPSGVTITIFIVLALELLLAFIDGSWPTIASVVFSGLLFTWLIFDKNAYYTSIGLTGVSLLVAFAVCPFVKYSIAEKMELVIPSLLLNLVNLVLLLPVYHIDSFEFTPAEDPEENAGFKGDLF